MKNFRAHFYFNHYFINFHRFIPYQCCGLSQEISRSTVVAKIANMLQQSFQVSQYTCMSGGVGLYSKVQEEKAARIVEKKNSFINC